MKKLLFLTLILVSTITGFAQKAPKTDYIGVYKLSGAPFEKITLTVENGNLVAEAEGVGKSELKDTDANDEFKEPTNDATLVFKRNAGNVVEKIIIKVQGMELIGEKIMAQENAYVGKYQFEEGSPITEVTVVLKDGKLYGETEQGTAELKPTDKAEEFEIVGYGGTCVFTKDAAGKAKGLAMSVQGMTMKGSRK
jgi:hypothetical protein